MSVAELLLLGLLLVLSLVVLSQHGQRLRWDEEGRRMHKRLLRTLKDRDPSVAEVRAWAAKTGVWVGSPAELIGELTRQGFVVMTPDAWRAVAQQLERTRQPTVAEWLERKEEDGAR